MIQIHEYQNGFLIDTFGIFKKNNTRVLTIDSNSISIFDNIENKLIYKILLVNCEYFHHPNTYHLDLNNNSNHFNYYCSGVDERLFRPLAHKFIKEVGMDNIDDSVKEKIISVCMRNGFKFPKKITIEGEIIKFS